MSLTGAFGTLGTAFGRLGGGAGRAGFIPGASADLRFGKAYLAGNRRYSDFGDIPGVSVSGGLNGTVTLNGQLVQMDAPRIGDDRLEVEAETTNVLVNSKMGGAAVGVLGSGGAMPTLRPYDEWDTIEVLEVDDTNPHYDRIKIRVIRDNQTAGVRFCDIKFATAGNASEIAASSGQDWSASAYIEVVSYTGDKPLRLITQGRDGGTFRETLGSVVELPEVATAEHRYSASGTLSNALTDNIFFAIDCRLEPGESIDATFWVRLPQVEQTNAPSSPIITDDSAVTRTADSVTLTCADMGWASDQTVNLVYADGTTGTHDAVAGTFTFPVSTKAYARAYA